MKAIIVNGYAHQVQRNGQIISAKVEGFTPTEEFLPRNPALMNLTGGQASIIGHMLMNIANTIPANQSIPMPEVKEKKNVDVTAVIQ